MAKISREVAEQEITKWLDYKKVSEEFREQYASLIGKLIQSMVDGNLTLDDKHYFLFKPVDPVKNAAGETTVTEFKFKPRLRIKELRPFLSGVKAGDGDGRISAYVCALTNSNANIIGELYTEDYEICESIAVFFVS